MQLMTLSDELEKLELQNMIFSLDRPCHRDACENCVLSEIFPLPLSLRLKWFNALTLNEVVVIMRAHRQCLRQVHCEREFAFA